MEAVFLGGSLFSFSADRRFLGGRALSSDARRRRPPATIIHRFGDVLRVYSFFRPSKDIFHRIGEARRPFFSFRRAWALVH